MRLRTLFLFVALLLTAVACSSATSGGVAAAESSSAADQAVAPQTSAASDEATDGAATVPVGEPAATLTIGDQTWNFDVLVCAISIAEEGQIAVGSTITALNDDTRLALTTHPSSGAFADFTDFEFENPAIDFGSDAASTSIALQKNSFTGTGEFVDQTTDSLELIPGTFSGICR